MESILRSGMLKKVCLFLTRANETKDRRDETELCLNGDETGLNLSRKDLSDDYRQRYIIKNMSMWDHRVNKITFKRTLPELSPHRLVPSLPLSPVIAVRGLFVLESSIRFSSFPCA